MRPEAPSAARIQGHEPIDRRTRSSQPLPCRRSTRDPSRHRQFHGGDALGHAPPRPAHPLKDPDATDVKPERAAHQVPVAGAAPGLARHLGTSPRGYPRSFRISPPHDGQRPLWWSRADENAIIATGYGLAVDPHSRPEPTADVTQGPSRLGRLSGQTRKKTRWRGPEPRPHPRMSWAYRQIGRSYPRRRPGRQACQRVRANAEAAPPCPTAK